MSDDARRLAVRLHGRGLAVPARIALEALRPLRPLIGAGLTFGSGFLPVPATAVERLRTDAAWDELAAAIDPPRDECPTSEG
ncbi:MAG: hypothetical protein ABI534_01705 [Chloroflexota bacterium]